MEHGADLHVVVKGTSSEGKPITSSFMVPAKGGAGKIIESGYEGVSSKFEGDERVSTYTKGGKPVYTTRVKVLPGGKQISVAGKGTSLTGQEVDGIVYYDKQ
jgi:hypothetical protein